MKKALVGNANTAALAVVRRSQKNSPRRRPLPGGAGRSKFNQLEMVTTFIPANPEYNSVSEDAD